jgi:hypothetical protein
MGVINTIIKYRQNRSCPRINHTNKLTKEKNEKLRTNKRNKS